MTPEKLVWTETDFDMMGWLDAQIWAMYADDLKAEFVLDIDYIFKWEDPPSGEKYFSYWVSTVTMVFENVNGVAINMESPEGAMGVNKLYMEQSQGAGQLWQFRFECDQGELKILASGFKFYVRQLPILQREQYFSYESRDGISFARKTSSK